jgi:hypothetical protein
MVFIFVKIPIATTQYKALKVNDLRGFFYEHIQFEIKIYKLNVEYKNPYAKYKAIKYNHSQH